MADEKKSMSTKFTELKQEFNKVIWPNKEQVGKQSTAVIIASVVVGLIIVVVDTVIQYGIDFLIQMQEVFGYGGGYVRDDNVRRGT